MKFEARSLGMFEILTVRQDANEVFDADQMLQIVRSMLERDSLQIVIDVSALEYLYSDAINALVSINRRVLERGGHLSLLASQSKIREILLRSGLDSLFRIYKAEGELSVESTEFLRKSTMLAKDAGSSTAYAQAIKAVAPPEEGPSARRLRRRSGPRKEQSPRRPVGRQEGNSSVGSSVQSSSGSVAGSSFPSDFVWDETSSSSASDVTPTAEKPLEIYRGIEAPEEPSSAPPPVPPAPQGFFFPPPPQED